MPPTDDLDMKVLAERDRITYALYTIGGALQRTASRLDRLPMRELCDALPHLVLPTAQLEEIDRTIWKPRRAGAYETPDECRLITGSDDLAPPPPESVRKSRGEF
jgi:hypothetical protein